MCRIWIRDCYVCGAVTHLSSVVPLVNKAALAPGTVVAGKYVVNRFIGAGGMAQVYEALNQDIDERVALKVIHPAFRDDPAVAAKFRFEACSAARIRSEFVARVFDVASTSDGFPVIVMEFLEGLDLRSWIDAHGLPSTEQAIGWVIEACGGLAVAHANGIVHRDVKPENLFIAEELGGRTQVKLLDFGISRSALTHNPARAGSGEHGPLRLLGTPTYMAPEQITSSRAADPRVDVWSIGILLHELLTGRAPFSGTTPEDTCLAILENRKADLALLRPDLPREVLDVVEACLQRLPEARPPSVADIAAALFPFANDQQAISVDRTVTLLRSAGLTEAASPRQRAHTVPDLVPPPVRVLTPLPAPHVSSPPPEPPVSTPAPVAHVSAAPAAPSRFGLRHAAIAVLLLGGIAAVAAFFGASRATSPSVAAASSAAPAGTEASATPSSATPPSATPPSADGRPEQAASPTDADADPSATPSSPAETRPATPRASRPSRAKDRGDPQQGAVSPPSSSPSAGRPPVKLLPDDDSKVRIIE